MSGSAARGDLIVIAAPSGAGKTTLVRALLERMPELVFSISHTTRRPRPAESDGVDYFFVDEAEFVRMVEAGQFLEHALVFDHWYGTGKAYVEHLRAQGRTVLLEIDSVPCAAVHDFEGLLVVRRRGDRAGCHGGRRCVDFRAAQRPRERDQIR